MLYGGESACWSSLDRLWRNLRCRVRTGDGRFRHWATSGHILHRWGKEGQFLQQRLWCETVRSGVTALANNTKRQPSNVSGAGVATCWVLVLCSKKIMSLKRHKRRWSSKDLLTTKMVVKRHTLLVAYYASSLRCTECYTRWMDEEKWFEVLLILYAYIDALSNCIVPLL